MNVINETISIIEDSRASKLGMKCAKEIFEIAILPALLNNSELFPIQDKMVQLALDDFQLKFWRGLLRVPKSCPLPALFYETNSMQMKFRVYNKILNLAKHIHSQSNEVLSKLIMTEQMKQDWPGLCKLAQLICDEL